MEESAGGRARLPARGQPPAGEGHAGPLGRGGRELSDEGVSIIVPAYNECDGIGPTLDRLKTAGEASGRPFEIIVVDDASTDGTADVLHERSDVCVVRHDENQGYGASLKDGIRSASHPIIAIIDADGTYPAERIMELAEHVGDTDMIVGARTGKNVHIPLVRRPAKWFIRTLASYLVARKIPDLNSGLRAFKRDVALRFFTILPSGFSFTTTLTLAFMTGGFRVGFVPIDYERRTGRSKIRPIRDTFNFILLIARAVVYFEPLRVFLPVSLLLTIAGLVAGILEAIYAKNVTDVAVLAILTGVQIGAIGVLADLIVKRTQP